MAYYLQARKQCKKNFKAALMNDSMRIKDREVKPDPTGALFARLRRIFFEQSAAILGMHAKLA